MRAVTGPRGRLGVTGSGPAGLHQRARALIRGRDADAQRTFAAAALLAAGDGPGRDCGRQRFRAASPR